MNQSPKISVIIVTYNAAAFLENAIVSVVNQTWRDFELLIIDGGSIDGTVSIIKKFQSEISYWVTEPDKGIYDAMTKGVMRARGEFVYFLGADDMLYNSAVFNEMEAKLIGKTIYYGDVLFKHKNIIYDKRFGAIKLATRNISHQSIFYPRLALLKYKFKGIYKIFADYDLNIRLFNSSEYKFKYISAVIAIFDDSGSSGSNIPDSNFERNRLLIMKKYFPFPVYVYRLLRTRLANIFVNHG